MSELQRDAGAPDRARRGFLDYYGSRGVIPVSQAAVGLEVRRRQRLGLYRTLGIPALAFRGSRVVEFGPGTGDNSEIAVSLGPASYDLVDGNEASVRALAAKLTDGRLDPAICRLVHADFNDERIDGVEHGAYDVVIAEGCIPGQEDPVATLRRVARYAAPDGLLIVTTADEISVLAEHCCRFVMAPVLAARGGDFDGSLEVACTIFEPHLSSLPSRSRSTRDWVIDMLLHPLPANWTLSIDEALLALEDFQFHGSSPRFSTEWRWYKALESDRPGNGPVVDNWRSLAHLVIDHRIDPTSIRQLAPWEFDAIKGACARVASLCYDVRESLDLSRLAAVEPELGVVAGLLAAIPGMERTVSSIDDFRRSIPVLAAGRWDYEYRDFLGWFGRGQQYLALTRSAD
jgi:SAM-dependent methyltransferase